MLLVVSSSHTTQILINRYVGLLGNRIRRRIILLGSYLNFWDSPDEFGEIIIAVQHSFKYPFISTDKTGKRPWNWIINNIILIVIIELKQPMTTLLNAMHTKIIVLFNRHSTNAPYFERHSPCPLFSVQLASSISCELR